MNIKDGIKKHLMQGMAFSLVVYLGIMIVLSARKVPWDSEIAIFINYLLCVYAICNVALFSLILIKGSIGRSFAWWKTFFIFDALILLIMYQTLLVIFDKHEFPQLSKSLDDILSVFVVSIPSFLVYFGFVSLILLKSNNRP